MTEGKTQRQTQRQTQRKTQGKREGKRWSVYTVYYCALCLRVCVCVQQVRRPTGRDFQGCVRLRQLLAR